MTSFPLEKLLPRLNLREDSTGDLTQFVNEVLQPPLDQVCAEADRWALQNDPQTADENSVNAQLADLGNPFAIALTLPLNRRRFLVRVLVAIYKIKGTEQAIIEALRALMAIEVVQFIKPVTITGWDLGADVLGDDENDPYPPDITLTDIAILGSNAQGGIYSFQIEVPNALTAQEISDATEIINLIKPAHEHFLGFVFSGVPLVINHIELGLSFLTDTAEPIQGDEIDLHD